MVGGTYSCVLVQLWNDIIFNLQHIINKLDISTDTCKRIYQRRLWIGKMMFYRKSLWNYSICFTRCIYINLRMRALWVIPCAGCPTLYAYEKILKHVKPLVEFAKADKIHFSICMEPYARSLKNINRLLKKHIRIWKLLWGLTPNPDIQMRRWKTFSTGFWLRISME